MLSWLKKTFGSGSDTSIKNIEESVLKPEAIPDIENQKSQEVISEAKAGNSFVESKSQEIESKSEEDYSVESSKSAKQVIHYVLPLRWSLFYALTQTQWRQLRERHKRVYPEWEQCACPKRCKADTLDEQWRYDKVAHVKIFVGAKFICRGCHWLKSPSWRIETWLKEQNGRLPPLSKSPHVIDCLGWTQQKVDALREKDIRGYKEQKDRLAHLENQVRLGKALVARLPLERLSPDESEQLLKPNVACIVPWRVDLSALAQYGYSCDEITVFENAMYKLASKRVLTL